MSVDQVLNVYFPTNESHEIPCETECIMRDSKKDKTTILVAIIIICRKWIHRMPDNRIKSRWFSLDGQHCCFELFSIVSMCLRQFCTKFPMEWFLRKQ